MRALRMIWKRTALLADARLEAVLELGDELPRVGTLRRFFELLVGVLVALEPVGDVLLDIAAKELCILRYLRIIPCNCALYNICVKSHSNISADSPVLCSREATEGSCPQGPGRRAGYGPS